MPWDISQNANLPAEIKKRGFNHATFYLNWSDIERQKGTFVFSHYYKALDALVANDLGLILVLDMGARPYLDETGRLIKEEFTVPKWVYKDNPQALMKNFSNQIAWQLDFGDAAVQNLSRNFISKTVEHFSKRYPGRILGYAIGLQEEHEIKYGQTGYQWRDYRESTQEEFQRLYGSKQPIINYNNEIIKGIPTAEPLLHAHKEFRENKLSQATCLYAKAIRDKGASAIGYFAETFTSHDAIYATGVIEKVVDCLDIAVIDFNFYDGYKLISDPDVLPILANYMGSLGYKKIIVGSYGEQWERRQKTNELIPVINQTIAKSLQQNNVIGLEIGGFQRQAARDQSATIDFEKLSSIVTTPPKPKPQNSDKKIKIGILGSTTNFYVWHGERSTGRNVHRDALFETYKILSNHPAIEARIIGEKNIIENEFLTTDLDSIFIPHQVALPQNIKIKLAAYWRNGGVLIQDMRLGEFDENGKPTFDWMHDVFGIESIEWKTKGGIFIINNQISRLKSSQKLYKSHAAITPRKGYELVGPDIIKRDQGVIVKGDRTLVFGFLPQLVEDDTREAWRNIFIREVVDITNKNRRKNMLVSK
ncbi:MAG: hypothetical protein EON49_12725 [Acidovorax sp.]|nr:MAG: hypothetical protein EON49_12725 [Acidovorax sp.]